MKTKLILLMTIFCLNIYSQQFPEHKTDSYVNDFANVIDDDKELVLDNKMRDFKSKSSIEMTIVTINSLEGRDIASYTNDLFRQWGVGTKELNNGLMMIISISDRKWRIEVGDGLEEYLTDGYIKVQAQSKFVPFLKEKPTPNYFGGFNSLLDDFIGKLGPIAWQERIDQKRKAAEQLEKEKAEFNDSLVSFLTWFGIFGGGVLIVVLLHYNEKRKKEKIEAEAREKKRRLESLVADNNLTIKEFSELAAWANSNKGLFINSRTVSFSKINEAKNKLDDLMPQRVLTIESMESEKILIRNIIEGIAESLRNTYAKYKELETLKSTISSYGRTSDGLLASVNTTSKNYFHAVGIYSSHVVEVAFPEKSLIAKIKNINDSLSILQSKSNIATLDDYATLKKEFDAIKSIEKDVSNQLNTVNSRLKNINDAVSYVSTNRGRISSLINDVQRRVGDRDVSSSTKSKFKTVKQKAEMYQESKNPLIAYNDMTQLINDLNSVKRNADSDIAEEERRRRRKREEEEEEERRRRDSISSSTSYSSFGGSDSSSSSSSSSSDFGGGSSSGGGSDGDW